MAWESLVLASTMDAQGLESLTPRAGPAQRTVEGGAGPRAPLLWTAQIWCWRCPLLTGSDIATPKHRQPLGSQAPLFWKSQSSEFGLLSEIIHSLWNYADYTELWKWRKICKRLQRLFGGVSSCSRVSGVVPGKAMLPSRVGGCGISFHTRVMRGRTTLVLCWLRLLNFASFRMDYTIASGCSEVSSQTFYIFAFCAGSSSPCLGIFLVDV